MKNQFMGELPKIGGKVETICRFKGGLAKKRWVVPLRGGMIPQCSLCTFLLKQHIPIETNIKSSKRSLSGKNKVSYIIYRGTKTDDVIFHEL